MRPLRLLALPALLSLMLCGTASAQDFCVAKPRCIGTAVTTVQFKAQLVAAQSNGTADRFFLGAVAFNDGPYAYRSGEPVEVVGANGGGTILRSFAGRAALALAGSTASSVSGLHVEIAIDGGMGVELERGTARDIDVTAPLGIDPSGGVLLSGGATLAASTVIVFGGSGIAAGSIGGEGTIVDSTLTAPSGGVAVDGGGRLTLVRDTLVSRNGAIAYDGAITLADTVIDGRGGGGGSSVGLASLGVGESAAITAERVTIVGSDATKTSTVGAYAVANGAGSSTIEIRDSVIAGIGLPLYRGADATSRANLVAAYVARGDNLAVADVGPGAFTDVHRLGAPTGFADAGAGDFRLAAGSPLIDAGDPAAAAPAGATDRDGAPRLDDGDGDCVARHDVGAYEFQRLVPRAVATAATATAAIGAPVGFSAAGSCDPEPGDQLTFAWSFDDGTTAAGAEVAHAFATAGRHTARLTVSDAGAHTATATATVEVVAPPAPGPAPLPGPAPRGDRSKPVLTGLRVPRRVTRGAALPLLVASRRVPAIAFRLSERANVRVRFARRGRGGRFRAAGAPLTVTARAGANRLRFAGRLTRRARLAPGLYRVTLTATDQAGNRSDAVTASLRIV